MARKRVEDTVPALESWDDVNQALATIADNQRTVENFEAAMQNKIDEAKAEAEARSRVFIEATKRLERQIKEFAEAHRDDMDGKKICEAVSAELLAFGPHCSQAALEKHLRDQKRNEREVREYLEERVRPYELRLEDGARPSDAVGMIDLTIKGTPSQKLVSLPKDRMFRSEQASKTSRKKATDDTFLNAKGDKALSLLRAMNE